MDTYTFNTQRWLKDTYGGVHCLPIDYLQADGQTGQDTIDALIAALQIELGFANPNGVFGEATTAAVKAMGDIYIDGDTEPSNIIRILQGACYAKGYDAGLGRLIGIYDMDNGGNAILQLKNDIGLSLVTTTVTYGIWEVLLSMKQFRLLPDYGGDAKIREIQQTINNSCFEYVEKYIACDGICQRDTVTGIIFAIQKEEGFGPYEATGEFGSTTSSLLPTLTLGSSNNFVLILNWCLYINGYSVSFSTEFSVLTMFAIQTFEAFMALPVTGIANASLMKYLLLSNGDVYRDVDGGDCATPLTQTRINLLKSYGYAHMGRYIAHGTINGMDKCLTVEEVNLILQNGISIFPIYQTSANYIDYFNDSQGAVDARNAITKARELGFLDGTVLYFAVDVDIMEGDVYGTVIPYFRAVFNTLVGSSNYRVGIYATRNTCSIVSRSGYATYSFINGISSGYSGNLGFSMPSNWAFNQIVTVNVGDFQVDNVAVSGRDIGVTKVNQSGTPSNEKPSIEHSNEQVFEQIQMLYNVAYEYTGNVSDANLLVAQYIRITESSYDNGDWNMIGGIPNKTFNTLANKALNNFPVLEIYDLLSGLPIGISHLAATMSAILFKFTETAEGDKIYDDVAGWAGDLITYSANIVGNTPEEMLSSARQLMGSPYGGSNFSYTDVLGDVDAVNITSLINQKQMSISAAFKQYYTSLGTDGYKYRFNKFFETTYYSDVQKMELQIDCYVSGGELYALFRQFLSNAPTSDEQYRIAGQAYSEFIIHKVNNGE